MDGTSLLTARSVGRAVDRVATPLVNHASLASRPVLSGCRSKSGGKDIGCTCVVGATAVSY